MLEREIIGLMQKRFEEIRIRRPEFSLRSYAKFLNLNPTQLSQTLVGKRRLTRKIAVRVLERLGASRSMITKASNSVSPSRNSFLEKAAESSFSPLQDSELTVIVEWFGPAILALAESPSFIGEPRWIAARLGVRIRDARRILKALVSLGLLQIGKNGRAFSTGRKFSTSCDVPSTTIRLHHLRTLEHAKTLLETVPVERREYRSHYFCSDPDRIAKAKTMINQFMLRLVKFLEEGKKSELYRISMQLAPLTNETNEKKEGIK